MKGEILAMSHKELDRLDIIKKLISNKPKNALNSLCEINLSKKIGDTIRRFFG